MRGTLQKSTADEPVDADIEAIPREAQKLQSKKETEHKPAPRAFRRVDVVAAIDAGEGPENQNHLPIDDARSIINSEENQRSEHLVGRSADHAVTAAAAAAEEAQQGT